MTKDQQEALYRVKASYAYANDLGAHGGSYQTKDIEAVLEILQENDDKVDGVKEDLQDLKEKLEADFSDTHDCFEYVPLVDSMIAFLSYEE